MEKFTFSATALLFSVVTLLLLGYVSWFLVDRRVVRSLHPTSDENTNSLLLEQVKDFRKRLRQTLAIQIAVISCLLLCLSFVNFLFMYLYIQTEMMFGISLGNGLHSGHFHP
jgi:hypothetical protein